MRRVCILVASVAALVVSLVAVDTTADAARTGGVFQSGCKLVFTKTMDPFAEELGQDPAHSHLHEFYGNKNIYQGATYSYLVNHPATTCKRQIVSSSYWNPANRDPDGRNQPTRLSFYYTRGGVSPSQLHQIPDGAKLYGTKEDFRCGAQSPTQSPPYGCRADEFRIRVHFPSCWTQQGLKSQAFVYSKGGSCPSGSVPIVRLRTAMHYNNKGGVLRRELKIAAGDGTWQDYTFMHGDAFEANQQPAFNRKIKFCVFNVGPNERTPDSCVP